MGKWCPGLVGLRGTRLRDGSTCAGMLGSCGQPPGFMSRCSCDVCHEPSKAFLLHNATYNVRLWSASSLSESICQDDRCDQEMGIRAHTHGRRIAPARLYGLPMKAPMCLDANNRVASASMGLQHRNPEPKNHAARAGTALTPKRQPGSTRAANLDAPGKGCLGG